MGLNLEKAEGYIQQNAHRNGDAISLSGNEFPGPNFLHRFLIQSHAEGLYHMNVRWVALRIHHQREHNLSLEFCFARGLRVVRAGRKNFLGRTHSATHAIDSATCPAALTRSKPASVPGANAATRA